MTVTLGACGGDTKPIVVSHIDTVPQPLPKPGSLTGRDCPPPAVSIGTLFPPGFLESEDNVEVTAGPSAGGVVKALSSTAYPLQFPRAPRVHLVVVSRDVTQIEASFPGARFRTADLHGVASLVAAIKAPADGPITVANHSSADEMVVVWTLVETGATASGACTTPG